MTTPAVDVGVLNELLTEEKRVWQALVDGDSQADREALHPEFLGVYPSGFATRDDHVGQLCDGPTVRSFDICDARLLALGHDHYCLSYAARFTRFKSTSDEAMYVSSIWQRQTGRWVNIFSQDTPVSEPDS